MFTLDRIDITNVSRGTFFCDKFVAYLMQTDRTIFKSVRPISTFSMPSIFSVRIPALTALANS